MTLTDNVVKNIIRKLLYEKDYRIEIITLINAEFIQFAIDFFKKIIEAKLNNKNLTIDWYKKEFLNSKLSSKEIAINSGLNKKTIHNMFNSSTKAIIIDAANEHYDSLYESIKKLVESEDELELTLTIKFKSVSVDLNVSESLIVINTLAVKRAELRGGLWSTAGKRVEKPLMITLCKLFNVPFKYHSQDNNPVSFREVDFYILSNDGKKLRTEVKLMGRGNPESADSIFAREPDIFVADTLSLKNKSQAESLGIHWVELRSKNGYKKFKEVLEKLNVPHGELKNVNENEIDSILDEIFSN